MTTQQQQSALLVDLQPSSRSSSAHNYVHLVKDKVSNFLSNNRATSKVIQLYILTSSDSSVSEAFGELLSNEELVRRAVIRADDMVGSFYEAKKQLDDLDITEIKLLCGADSEPFWKQVCQYLFTPVHAWDIETVNCPLSESAVSESANTPGEDGVKSPSSQTTVEQNSANSRETGNQTQARYPDSTSGIRPKSGDVGDESVLTQVQRCLQTLPSFLGLPEVDRSDILLDMGTGFAHGFSTRRGGVTAIPTMCAMNLVYTDKKRDSQLVVEENRRRLATVGGFNHQNFHIVKVEHGHRVWVVGEDQPPKFDALVTNRRDVTIAAAGADCIPLLFADPVAMVIGAAHAGWKGSVERVAGCVVETMREKFGSRPEDIRVAMGPGVRPGCFSVIQEDAKLFADIHPSCLVDTVESVCHRIDTILPQDGEVHGEGDGRSDETGNQQARASHRAELGDQKDLDRPAVSDDASVDADRSALAHANTENENSTTDGVHTLFSPIRNPRAQFEVQLVPAAQLKPKTPRTERDPSLHWTFVDLQMTNYHVLLQAGVKAEHIDMRTSHCTKCNPDLYFSYERDGFPFGNQIGFVCMSSSR